MIEVVNGTITIPNWEKHQSLDVAEKQRDQSRVRMAKYRERQKSIAATGTDVTQCCVTRYAYVTQCYATEEDIEEDIDKNIKEIDKEKPTRHKYGEYQNVLLIDLHNRNLAQKKRALQSVNDMSLTCQRSQGIEEDIEEDVDKNIKEINKESFCVFH
ncbi:MAG: phage replisome organizer N-terminal domain-containing protein [Oscillospiraceae bacterium]|nr:phage replisome organizer N-terminal domain-containing protein [Oscillospiraceae bacterium]MDY4624860.1 phage replisome organizer N-terminal domain-containing protein [Oscillospiraceae bacterium]